MFKYLNAGLEPSLMAEKGMLPSAEATLASQMEIAHQLDRIADALEQNNKAIERLISSQPPRISSRPF